MHKPSASLIVATLALVVALTGTAGATGLINGQSIKNHSITANKLAKASVTTFALRPASVTPATLADGVIINNTVIAPAGPAGPAGADATPIAGPPGAPGAAGVTGAQVVAASGVNTTFAVAVCPDGKVAIGGGYSVDPGIVVTSSMPSNGGQGWRVSTGNTSTGIAVYAVCATSAA